ncbi:nucleotidyltransferase family protein [Natranaerovirga pectinivora]|nr:nucleotidyltransferase family protein [Natranaerovirga pectinivora]
MNSDIEGVILAAGFSSRANAFKMALDFDGKSILQRNIEVMYPFCNRIIVVGGYKVEIIKELIKDYDKVELIYNEEYEKGMFSSVKAGIAKVKSARFLFTPGDYPLLSERTYNSLLEVDGEVVIPIYKGRKGHPIVLHNKLIPLILKEPMDSNLKAFIQNREIQLVKVEEKGILMDVDTIEDYEAAKAYFDKNN